MVVQLANFLKYRPPATDITRAHPATHSAAALQLHYAGQRMCPGAHAATQTYTCPAVISAVFNTSPSTPSDASNFNLDVAVHDGGVVFIKEFQACFDVPSSAETHQPNETPQWAIVLHSALASNIGCRVQSVMGPFWAKSGLASLEHEGQQWVVVHRSGEANA